jgi:hypothetical protein
MGVFVKRTGRAAKAPNASDPETEAIEQEQLLKST